MHPNLCFTALNIHKRTQLWSCQGHDQGLDHGERLCQALCHDIGQDLVQMHSQSHRCRYKMYCK